MRNYQFDRSFSLCAPQHYSVLWIQSTRRVYDSMCRQSRRSRHLHVRNKKGKNKKRKKPDPGPWTLTQLEIIDRIGAPADVHPDPGTWPVRVAIIVQILKFPLFDPFFQGFEYPLLNSPRVLSVCAEKTAPLNQGFKVRRESTKTTLNGKWTRLGKFPTHRDP